MTYDTNATICIWELQFTKKKEHQCFWSTEEDCLEAAEYFSGAEVRCARITGQFRDKLFLESIENWKQYDKPFLLVGNWGQYTRNCANRSRLNVHNFLEGSFRPRPGFALCCSVFIAIIYFWNLLLTKSLL